MEKADKVRYAKGIERIKGGIYGFSNTLFFAVNLTTREGDDNQFERFSKDFKKLVRWMRGSHTLEYCGVMGLTPQKGLVHGHFIFRVKYGYFKLYSGKEKDNREAWFDERGLKHTKHIDANRKALGDKWNEIHNAFVVHMGDFPEGFEIERYISEHVMKDYTVNGMYGRRFLVSGGWRKKFSVRDERFIKNWWRNSITTACMTSDDYRLLSIVRKKICEGETFDVGNINGVARIEKGIIKYAEIFGE